MTEPTIQKQSRIPTSASVVWSNVRVRILPIFVFGGVVAVLVTQWHRLEGGGIPGIAEGARSVVSAPQSGLLQQVHVRPYQWVQAGQPVASFLPFDPRAKLDLLQSELQIARLRLQPSLADQNALDFERLRVDDLRLKQELAAAKVNLARAENTLRRYTELRQDKLVSEEAYDLSVRDRDMYLSEIKEKSSASAEIESRMAKLRLVGEPDEPGTNAAMHALLAQLDSRLAEVGSNWCAIPLLAPISGMVHIVYRQTGEYVTDREPIITINSARSDRVIAYLRQPYAIEPEPGIPVEVVTRTRHRQKFLTHISEVGAQVETITNSLAYMRIGALVDVGLPLVVSLPPDCNVRPGETVDVIMRKDLAKPEPGPARASKPTSGFSRAP